MKNAVFYRSKSLKLGPMGKGAPLRDMISAGIPCGKLTEIRRNSGRIVETCAAIRDNERLEFPASIEESDCNLILLKSAQEIESVLSAISRIEEYELNQCNGFSPIYDRQVIVATNEKSPLSRKA
ncbi:MAG: hypothetical protein ACRC2T_04805, partial [Thermoguttaceae bacterium]